MTEFKATLEFIRSNTGTPLTTGLDSKTIADFLEVDASLRQCLNEARSYFDKALAEYPEILKLDEQVAILKLQEDIISFYPDDQANPYIPLHGVGPWIVTLYGAIIHDSGGYGMLGLGHLPQKVLDTMAKPYVIANVMTASLTHQKTTKRLHQEIGQTRKDQPFSKFIFMNSGSESVTVALRISDANAKQHAPKGSRNLFLNFKGSFHGRTDRPAHASHSSRPKYVKNLASFAADYTHSITVNDREELEEAFRWAKENDVFFEALLMEPVMGEGNPGKAVEREFYDHCRKLTLENNCLLIVDSIQAAIRAQGYLSICDYPGFQDCLPPDMETYSKAINAGQFPLSILALNDATATKYVKGIYGNTMTANPRALEIACTVLELTTEKTRTNIRERGKEFVEKFSQIAEDFPEDVVSVQGTGLLCCIELNPERHKVCGAGQVEEQLRKAGIGVIHGGKNALRFTPHFNITSKEVDLIITHIRKVLKK